MDEHIVVVNAFGAEGTRYLVVKTSYATPAVIAVVKDQTLAASIAVALNGS